MVILWKIYLIILLKNQCHYHISLKKKNQWWKGKAKEISGEWGNKKRKERKWLIVSIRSVWYGE